MPPDAGPMHSFRTTTVDHGKIVRLEPSPAENPSLTFQYNPETVTRSRTGRWEPRKRRRDVNAVETPQQRRGSLGGQGSAALLSEAETISFRLVFDATEAILRDAANAAPPSGAAGPRAASTAPGQVAAETDAFSTGVLDQLAFLEMVSLGREERERQSGQGRATPGQEIKPIRPDQLLLSLGETRWFPCVITEMTITEQRFTPRLVPVRAEVDLKLTVLEPVENAYNRFVRQTFVHLLEQRQARVNRLQSTTSNDMLRSLLGGSEQ